MSNQVWVRPMNDTPEERKMLAEFLYRCREQNRFDPSIFTKNQVKVFVAYDQEGIVGFIPVRLSYKLESLSWRADVSPVTQSKALLAVQQVLGCKAAENNIPDVYATTTDPTLIRFAEHYGWETVDMPVIKLKFSNLEKPNEN
jgi:hypothetical protein